MPHEEAARRLARQIEAASKSERLSVDAEAVGELRRRGAAELHRVCAEFVSSVKKNLSEAQIELAPSAYSPETFHETVVNVMQISSQGRQVQITFAAGGQLVSTEKFRIPYVLEGEVRAYSQKRCAPTARRCWNASTFSPSRSSTASGMTSSAGDFTIGALCAAAL